MCLVARHSFLLLEVVLNLRDERHAYITFNEAVRSDLYVNIIDFGTVLTRARNRLRWRLLERTCSFTSILVSSSTVLRSVILVIESLPDRPTRYLSSQGVKKLRRPGLTTLLASGSGETFDDASDPRPGIVTSDPCLSNIRPTSSREDGISKETIWHRACDRDWLVFVLTSRSLSRGHGQLNLRRCHVYL